MSFPAVVTLWYVNTADPASVLEREPKADRGFGRKLLAQVNPAWPITPIGSFPLNRSSVPGRDEFYIAGFPGVSVVRMRIDDASALSTGSEWLTALPASDVFVIATGTDNDYGGFAHFTGETVVRSFCATRTHVIEDIGLPEPFEAPYWAGERAEQAGGIALPFEPKDLALSAQRHWLGVGVGEDGPDINVVGYAVDGRPEPKIEEKAPAAQAKTVDTVDAVAAKLAEKTKAYDDYEDAPERETGDEFAELADASVAAARRVGRGLRRRWAEFWKALAQRIRHFDR